MRRAAAAIRSLRVLRRWLPRSDTSGLRELAHDRGQVGPDRLAADPAVVGELDHVQQAELERPPATLEAEGAPDRPAPPDRLVDEEPLAVEPPEAGVLAVRQ